DTVQFVYKATNYYAPQSERSIIWNDPEIGIDWPRLQDFLVSEKDSRGSMFSFAEVYE
ncbi:TPA: dTDP-4-dehydrorhamnose 3,5-epimerase family protein, partial [Klebsiella pneumoniae]|nr:dTDP-4-dehydrorhamnose 3,5-epimerase family protein [Klebsiella pneumoniae]